MDDLSKTVLELTLRDWHSRERGVPQTEILLWTTPEGPPEALQASECGELLDFARASCLILAQRQPGKFICPPAHVMKAFERKNKTEVLGVRAERAKGPSKNCKNRHRLNLTGIGVVFN